MVGRSINLAAAAGQGGTKGRYAMATIDTLLQLSVVSATTTAQPVAPTVDDAYIIPTGKTGAVWATFAVGSIAVYRGTSFADYAATGYWQQITPLEGWSAWVADTDADVRYNADAWTSDDTTESALAAQRDAGQLQGFKNRLMNGVFAINQRVAASNADDTYAHDRWNVLTQTGAVACTTLTDPESGAATGIRITQSQASAQRMGISQIIESANCRDLRSAIMTLAGRLRLSTAANVRYAVLEWTGTADSVTSDIVLDWTSSGYTQGGGFFATTTTNVLATGVVATAAATWRALDALNATAGASMNNLIVFVWTEATVAQNVTLDLTRMQLEPGAVATRFEQIPIAVELLRCQRYYQKSFSQTTAPAQAAGQNTGEYQFPATRLTTAATYTARIPLVVKRATPTVTLFNPVSANAVAYDLDAAGDCSSSTVANQTPSGFSLNLSGNAGGAVGNRLRIHWTAESEL